MNKQSCPAKVLPSILIAYDNHKNTKMHFSLNITTLNTYTQIFFHFFLHYSLSLFLINEEIKTYMQSNH